MSGCITALAIGDPHFRPKYIPVVDEFVEQTLEIIKSQKPHFVVVLGDTLHNHEQAKESCHRRAVKWFQDMAAITKLYVLIGNHDRPNNSHFLTENHFFNGLKGTPNIVIVDKVHSMNAEVSGKQFRFVFVPYVPPGKFQDALDTLEESISDDPPKAIFAHQEFKGVKMGAIESEDGDEWGDDKPFVVSGHVHEYQMLGRNILYTGTPFQTTFAEANNKGVFLFSFGGDRDGAKRIRLRLRVKEKVTLQAAEVADWKLPETNSDEGDIDLRVDILGTKEELAGVKQLPAYKTMKETSWIKVVLRPIFEQTERSGDLSKVSYMQVFYDSIKERPELEALYREMFKEIK